MEVFQTLFLLLGAHFFVDFAVQGDAVATGKNKFIEPAKYGVPWYYWLLSHAFAHGFFVAIITNFYLGALEVIIHFAIDYAKCAKKIDIHVDQEAHILFKFGWCILFYYVF